MTIGLFSFTTNDSKLDLILNYLQSTYKSENPSINNEILVYNKENQVYPIETKLISQQSKQYIYQTKLLTPHMEYQLLNVALLIDSFHNITTIHSPTYDSNQQNFLNKFVGLKAQSKPEEKQIVKEIANVLSQITYKGTTKNLIQNENVWTIELWHGHLYWRRINIEFTSNSITKVFLTNPKKVK